MGYNAAIYFPLSGDPAGNIITVNNVPLIISTDINFNIFFAELEKYFAHAADKKTIPDIINIIHEFKSFALKHNRLSNIPLIRLPNTEWFKALDLENEVNIMNRKTIMQYLQKKRPFEVNKKALLMYEPYIPMKVVFKAANSAIIPINTKKNNYFFESIDNYWKFFSINSAFKIFLPFEEYAYINNFYIKTYEINLMNNEGIPGELGKAEYKDKKISLSNVIITRQKKSVTINFTFTANKKPSYYQMANNKITLLTDVKQIKQYTTKFSAAEKDIKKEYQEFVQKIKTIQDKPMETDVMLALRKLTDALNALKTSL